jgi:hypothetical protein
VLRDRSALAKPAFGFRASSAENPVEVVGKLFDLSGSLVSN